MYCRYCAAEIPDNSQFCPKCGAPLGAVWGAPPPGAFPPPPPMPFEQAKTSGKAIASLVCGCLFFLFPVPIVGIVLGHMALSEIRRSAGQIKGEGLAIAGLVAGYASGVFLPFLLILAAIVIPNLVRTRLVPNEAGAIGTLHLYNQKISAYAKLCPDRGYPASNANLGPGKGDCERANLVAPTLSSGQPLNSGYFFFYQAAGRDRSGHTLHYTINADPFQGRQRGLRHFFTDETGVIRYAVDRPADKNSPPLAQGDAGGSKDNDEEDKEQ